MGPPTKKAYDGQKRTMISLMLCLWADYIDNIVDGKECFMESLVRFITPSIGEKKPYTWLKFNKGCLTAGCPLERFDGPNNIYILPKKYLFSTFAKEFLNDKISMDKNEGELSKFGRFMDKEGFRKTHGKIKDRRTKHKMVDLPF